MRPHSGEMARRIVSKEGFFMGLGDELDSNDFSPTSPRRGNGGGIVAVVDIFLERAAQKDNSAECANAHCVKKTIRERKAARIRRKEFTVIQFNLRGWNLALSGD